MREFEHCRLDNVAESLIVTSCAQAIEYLALVLWIAIFVYAALSAATVPTRSDIISGRWLGLPSDLHIIVLLHRRRDKTSFFLAETAVARGRVKLAF